MVVFRCLWNQKEGYFPRVCAGFKCLIFLFVIPNGKVTNERKFYVFSRELGQFTDALQGETGASGGCILKSLRLVVQRRL